MDSNCNEINEFSDRKSRALNATRSIVMDYISKGMTIIVSLISIPLTLNYLEKERYGLWLIINSVIAYLNLADFGLGFGLQNRVAELRGERKLGEIGDVLSTAFFSTCLISLSVIVIGVIGLWRIPIIDIFNITTDQIGYEWMTTLLFILITTAIMMPLRIVNNAQVGFQEAYYYSIWNIIGTLLSLLVLIYAINKKSSMVLLALSVFSLPNIIKYVLNSIFFFKRHPYANISIKRIRISWFKSLLEIGWQFAFLSLLVFGIQQSDNIIIGTTIGPEAVVPYGTAYQLISLPLILLASIPTQMWPAYTEANASNDWVWIQSVYKKVTIYTVLIASLISVTLFIWGQEIIKYWAGEEAIGSLWMMAGLCVFLIFSQWTRCQTSLTNALNKPITSGISGMFEVVIKIVLSIHLIPYWGIAGVAWGTTIGHIITSSWYLPLKVWKITGKKLVPPWKDVIKVAGVPILISLIIGYWFFNHRMPGLIWVIFGALLTSFVFLGMAYLMLPKEFRFELTEIIKSFGDKIISMKQSSG